MLDAMKTILNQLDAFVYVTDLETNEILFVNRKMQETFGHNRDVVGALCYKTIQKGFTQRCPFCPIHQLEIAPDVPVVWETQNTLNRRYYKNTDSIIEWTDGKKAHLQYSIDITDIKYSQREAATSNEILKNILNGMAAYIYVSDMHTDEILFINNSMREAFGLGKDAVGKICWQVLQQGFTERCSFCPNFKLEKDPSSEVVWEEHNTLTHRHYKNVDSVISWTDGRLVHMQHSTDVTDLKNAISAAESASRSKSQFLSNMSHEIRTPMNAILGMTDILLNEQVTERQRRYLNDIHISANSLLGIINDILDFSKIEAGKLELVPVDFSIMELLDNLDSIFAFAAEQKGLFFFLDIHDRLPDFLYGDDLRLRQALVNVIGNAIKFTKHGGVTLGVNLTPTHLEFHVADTGIGIKPEELQSIFEEFGQLDARNNRNITGTGLGLSITSSLIHLMGGTITVESVYGQGTTFHLSIPYQLGSEVKAKDSHTITSEAIEAPDAKILVVDDNEINLNVATGILGMANIKCDTALSGWEAIRKIDTEGKKYHIVFMDHMMPEMDGVETTRVLRETHPPEELTIIALTANAVGGSKEILLAAGMNDFLSKPIDNKQLTRILRKWLPPDLVHRLKKPAAQTSPAPADASRFHGECAAAAGDAIPDKLNSPLFRRLRQIQGMDLDSALKCLSGMEELYGNSLALLVRRLPESLTRLENFLANGDLKSFAIEVHGLKGSLRTIGAMALGDASEEFEQAAKDRQLDFCAENLPDYLAAVRALREKLAAAMEEPAPAVAPPPSPTEAKGEAAELREKLAEVRALLDSFESDAALELLGMAKGKDYGEELNAKVKQIAGKIEEFDYDGAMALIDALPTDATR